MTNEQSCPCGADDDHPLGRCDQCRKRLQLAAAANEIGAASRRAGAPILTELSDAPTIARWLQWCDPNGCHTEALATIEGCEPYTVESAWEALESMIRQ